MMSANAPAPKANRTSGNDAAACTSDTMTGEGDRSVITQPEAGEFKAFTAVCTHQGCTVGNVRNGIIHCPCHGSDFKITDGSVAKGPADTPLQEYPVQVENGGIVVT